jgi:acetoin utilization deacetylase AcuC-like enzyme
MTLKHSLTIISHPDCVLHHVGEDHPEHPTRIEVIGEALRHFPFPEKPTFLLAPLASKEALQATHDKDYVEWIFAIAPTANMVGIDADTWMNPYTLQAARLAAGSVILAVDLVMQDKARVVFCNVRPPGHHAEYAKAMGFCFFNNVAVGVMHALHRYGLKRIAIVDFDVHHGNGTQDIFQEEDRVLYCSSFQHPFYPGYDPAKDNAHLLNVPLPAGTSSEEFRRQVGAKWLERIRAFAPELIFFSAGFDAHQHDPLANIHLEQADYEWLSEQVAAIADECCAGKMISVLEGGYDLEVLRTCVPAHLNALVK